MCAPANHYIYTLQGSEEGGREKEEENGGQENDTCINEYSDWKNRIDCMASIYILSNCCLCVKYSDCDQFEERHNMSPSGQLTSEQLKGIIEIKLNMDTDARVGQEQVEDGEEVLDSANTSSLLDMVLHIINYEFEHNCLDEAVMLLNAHSISQSTDDRVLGHKYSIPGLPATIFLSRNVWSFWFTVRRWVWDGDMPEALVADRMGLGKTFTSVAVAMICK